MQRLQRPEITGLLWLVARVWVGWEFLQAGWEKITAPDRAFWIGAHAGVAEQGFLQFSLQLAPGGAMVQQGHPEVMGWYATLIRQVFLPHAVLFSYLVTFGEILVGIALILGIVTRFAAAMGLLMNLSYLLAGVSSFSPLMLLIELPIVLGGTAATYYALDRVLLPYLRGQFVRPPLPDWTAPQVAPN